MHALMCACLFGLIAIAFSVLNLSRGCTLEGKLSRLRAVRKSIGREAMPDGESTEADVVSETDFWAQKDESGSWKYKRKLQSPGISRHFKCFWTSVSRRLIGGGRVQDTASAHFSRTAVWPPSAGRLLTLPCAPMMDQRRWSGEEYQPPWTPTSPTCFEKMGCFYIVEGKALL